MRNLLWTLAGSFTFTSLLVASPPKLSPMTPATKAEWRQDLAWFAGQLPKRHANAFHSVSREQFAQAAAGLEGGAETASDDQLFVGLMHLTSLIGDGHTGVHIPSNFHQYPLAIVRIEGAYRVVRGAGPAAALVGGKLTKIDDMPLDEVITRVHSILTHGESDVYVEAFTAPWLVMPEILHGLGVAKSAASARFDVTLDDGTQRSADVPAIEMGAKPEWRAASASQPLYRQRPEETFWFTWLEASGTVYVSFRSYEDLHAKSHDMWSFVDSHPVRKIVIDIRQNGGGDFNVGRRNMVEPLARRKDLRAYVVIGSRTFSAALKNAIDFRTMAHATLVGETIGERPNSYSENDEMTLPHTKIVVSYSTKFYTFLPGDAGLVRPDREILPTWADWLAGRDPVMDWILAQER